MPDPISWAYAWPYLAAAFVFSYLVGSVPFGLLLTRLFRAGDLRKIGSGNIGATNVLRTGRKDLAAATLVLDAGKGALAVLLAAHYGPDTALVAGFGAFLGHLFPVWLRFRGGKGVAVTLGVLLALSWPLGLGVFAVWLATAAAFRYSSLAALVAAALAPVLAWWIARDLQLVEFVAALAVVVWLRHLDNIARLVRGTEGRIGRKDKA